MKVKSVHSAEFVKRPNRFLGQVLLNDEIVDVFIPNPGRMYELMIPGKEVFIREANPQGRKTNFNMIAVKHEGIIVSIDSYLPNRFMKELLKRREFPRFSGYTDVRSEPPVYEGRFDFFLDGPETKVYIEVKSCTLVNERHAIFPDAPTSRGARHVRNLARSLDDGIVDRASVIFVVQRPDVDVFSPNDFTDPQFGSVLRKSHDRGVEVYALRTEVVDWNLESRGEIPVDLDYFSNQR
ncbi:MAG: DNA/RNA nuclease SfsA [Candidatus Thorarchaeota archaeon]